MRGVGSGGVHFRFGTLLPGNLRLIEEILLAAFQDKILIDGFIGGIFQGI